MGDNKKKEEGILLINVIEALVIIPHHSFVINISREL